MRRAGASGHLAVGSRRPPLLRLSVRAPAHAAEAVLAALLDLAPTGLEQRDGEGWVEYALYGRPEELPALADGDATVGGAPVSIAYERVPADWAERWKSFHRPRTIGGRLYLRPPWAVPTPAPELTEIVIDPGQAFGTGTHATTRLCLDLMLALPPGGAFSDLGCGSGVLAIAAAKLGFGPVAAFDLDAAAIDATERNARANGVVLERVERLDLRAQAPPPADVEVANLSRPLLLELAGSPRRSRPPALVASGLLEREADAVAAAFAPMRERERRRDEGWAAVLLVRPS